MRAAPADPVAPGEGIPRPTDVLVARLNEIKRVSKSLAAYYATLGHAHEAHGKALTTLTQGETIRLPWLEQDLFLPHVGAPEGEGGWAELVGKLKDGTGQEGKNRRLAGSSPKVLLTTRMTVCTAEDHLELSRITSSEIVEPLKHLVCLEAAVLARVDRTGTSVLRMDSTLPRSASPSRTSSPTSKSTSTRFSLRLRKLGKPLLDCALTGRRFANSLTA